VDLSEEYGLSSSESLPGLAALFFRKAFGEDKTV
jgi:hypothetical protein